MNRDQSVLEQAAIREYFAAQQRLLDLGIAQTRQNFTGSIGEWATAKLMGGTLRVTNSKDGDMVLPDGRTVEVKTVASTSKKTSFMRNLDETGRLLDEWVAVTVLDVETGEVVHCRLLNNEQVNKCKAYNSRTKACVIDVKLALEIGEKIC